MLINTPTADLAAASSPAAVRGDVVGSVHIHVNSSDANSDLYTCASDVYFEGWIVPNASSATMEVKVNGVELTMKSNTTYDMQNRPIALGPNDTLQCGGTSYFGVNGLLRRA